MSLLELAPSTRIVVYFKLRYTLVLRFEGFVEVDSPAGTLAADADDSNEGSQNSKLIRRFAQPSGSSS
jgi:hypothetical protein